MTSRAMMRSGIGQLSRWLGLSKYIRRVFPRASPGAGPADRGQFAGGKLADVTDLMLPEFGANFRGRFPDGAASLPPRKLWELAWLADRFEEHRLGGGTFLGLGVGHEPLIHHLTHLAKVVVATDLYSTGTAWSEARLAAEAVYESSPFPYPRGRLTVQNMDMRRLDYPADSFDAVWSCSSVEHVQTIPQLVQIFREAHRVLKPGGMALITTEFSLGDPYFLPGVLSLWKDSALFGRGLRGLTLDGPVDLHYRGDVPGNRPTVRRNVHRLDMLNDFMGGPAGMCIHIGYTRSIPIALAFRKTGPTFDWPEHLGAPAWYEPFAAGVEVFADKGRAAEAAGLFRKALPAADTAGARLHCYRALVEAHVHAGQVQELHETLAECQEIAPDFPDDDDALDLIGYVAAGAGRLSLARRCWEKAAASPSALPASRLRVRINQLEAELTAEGLNSEAWHLAHLVEAAWCESLDFLGAGDLLLTQLGDRYQALRQRYQLATPPARPIPARPAPAPAPPAPVVTIRNPEFNVAAPPARPLVYTGDHLALTRTVYGHKMFVDSRTQMGACFLLDGFWEEWITRHLKDIVKPGMHVVDVGANMGFYTLLLADLVGPTGRVTAFEAQPALFDILARNVELNGFQDRTTLVQKVVHEAAGVYPFASFDRYGTGAVSPDARGLTPGFEELGFRDKPVLTQLEGVSLDEHFGGEPPQVDLIKIDTDGAEPFVFRGMQTLLRSGRPLTILCEFCPSLYREQSIDPSRFLEEIRDAGFRVSEFTPEGIKPIDSLPQLAAVKWAELLLVRDSG